MSVRSAIAVVAVVALVGLLVFGLLSKGSTRLQPGDKVPVTVLPRLEGGGRGSLAHYRGHWVLVNFWASWCLPCHEEAPTLEQFQHRHGGADFTILGVDTQDLGDDGRAFAHRYGLDYPQLHDGEGELAGEFGTSGVPENFLVGPNGRVKLVNPGPLDATYLREQVAPLLPKESS